MQDKDTTTSTFFQLFRPILSEDLWAHIYEKVPGTDKYVRKLKTVQLFELLIHAEMQTYRSLDEIRNSLNDDQFSQLIHLDSISASTISRRLRELPLEITQILFNSITSQVGREIGFNSIRQELGCLYLIDSTTISLCLSQYSWADFRKTKGGVKAHLRLKFDGESTPDKVIITPARPADKTQMDQLVVDEEGALNVFDRAYVDYRRFDTYCGNGIRFTSRLKENAIIEVIEEFQVKPGSHVKKDQKVRLGKEGTTKMAHEVRLVIAEDLEGNPIKIVTNDFNLSAEEISDIYRYRWKIELFFKWIKQHLQIKHLFSKSKQGVENQIFIALITYCLLQLIKLKTAYTGNLLAIKRLVLTCLYETFTNFVGKLYPKGKRKSRGRRVINHAKIFEETVTQVMSREYEDLYYSCEIL
ncbi:MAG: IS4 family transposase [Desulfitobacterium hafniense]|nr:IS4 family transposase [Desulfitobacterium hafniense]